MYQVRDKVQFELNNLEKRVKELENENKLAYVKLESLVEKNESFKRKL